MDAAGERLLWGRGIGNLARNPSALILTSSLLNIGFRLCSNLVLAHLLLPRDFGLVAITAFIATGLSMITDIGLWISIVRKRAGITAEWLRQLWTLQMIRGLVLWAVAVVCAPLLAHFYGDPFLAVLLPVTGVTLTVQGLQSLRPMVRAASLDPILNIKVQLAGQLIGSAVSIVCAVIRPDAWALVSGMISGALAQTFLGFAWSGDRPPRPLLTRGFLAEQLRLAAWLGASSGVGFVAAQLDRIIFPALYGVAAFGVYGLAVILAQMPLQLGQRWADNVFMPALAKNVGADADVHHAEIRQLGRTVTAYIALGTGLMAGLGRPFFDALYPAPYADGGTFVQLLAIATYASLLTYLHRRQFLYQGRMKIELLVEMLRAGLFVAGLISALALLGSLRAIDYVLLYALVQLAVYGSLLMVARLRAGLVVRDDLPAHVIFVATALLLITIDMAVTRGFGAFVSLLATSAVGAGICMLGAAKLGPPKLPTAAPPIAEGER